MRLNDREVVLLAQVLAIYEDTRLNAGTSDMQRAVADLRKRAENWLAGEAEEEEEGFVLTIPSFESDFNIYPEDDDEKACDDGCGTEEGAGKEDEEERPLEGEGDVPPSEDGERAPEVAGEAEPDELRSDCVRTHLQLFGLPGLKTKLGKARFLGDGDTVNFDVNGSELVVEDVTHIRRFAKTVHLRDGYGEWHVFAVKKWPKLWLNRLPLKQLAEVCES